jgi:peptidoglycan-associated lipoprotein
MKRLILLFVLSAVLALHGCGPKQVSVPLSERIGSSASQTGAGEHAVNKGDSQRRGDGIREETLTGEGKDRRDTGATTAAGENQLTPQLQDIFFEFDSYSIRGEDVPTLKAIAAWLLARPKAIISIEGHCDERGTTDYNLALGQKRAEAAKDYLAKMGVSEKQLRAISFGKEAPLEQGHSEQAWQKNRRAHFVAR